MTLITLWSERVKKAASNSITGFMCEIKQNQLGNIDAILVHPIIVSNYCTIYQNLASDWRFQLNLHSVCYAVLYYLLLCRRHPMLC